MDNLVWKKVHWPISLSVMMECATLVFLAKELLNLIFLPVSKASIFKQYFLFLFIFYMEFLSENFPVLIFDL